MWLAETTPAQRRALLAAYAGYGLDGFDFMLYSFLIPTLIDLWRLTSAQAGYIASGALLASALGGWGAGILADRFGRARILQLTVLWFALFTFLSGFTQSWGALLFTRTMQGLGFGGEWCVGSVLVAEMIDTRHRGKASGLVQSSWSVGWAGAAVAFWCLSFLFPAQWSWRMMFWLGLLPALLVIYIRRRVTEPPEYLQRYAQRRSRQTKPPGAANFLSIFSSSLRGTTVLTTLLSAGMMGAYYSVSTWLPTYLTRERHMSAGATTGYLLMVILGSLAGFLTSAWCADRFGRRRGFIFFAIAAAAMIVLYTRLPAAGPLLLVGFPLGFFVLGIFAGMGAFLAELYPGNVRGSGQGFSYSVGRALGGFCPALIGALSARFGLGGSIGAFTVGAYALVVAAAWALPETRGRALPVDHPWAVDHP